MPCNINTKSEHAAHNAREDPPLRLHHLTRDLHLSDGVHGVVRAVDHARLEPDQVSDLDGLSELDFINLQKQNSIQISFSRVLITSTNFTGLPAKV